MPQVTNPLLTFRVNLPKRKHVRVVVWPDIPALRANTPESQMDDYGALFLPINAEAAMAKGACLGTLHYAQTDLKNGTRAHEISHAVDHFIATLVDELRAQTTETMTNDIDAALSRAGLL